MATCAVLAQVPDPKLARAGLAPFSHSPRDGVTATSASGFVVLHGGQPVVLASAAAVYPLLPPHRRQSGSLAGTRHADLVPEAQLAAVLPEQCSSNSSAAAEGASNAENTGQPDNGAIEVRLVGVAELPGVRQALARLLAAPSSAGPGGWQIGWLLHQAGRAAAPAQLSQLPAHQVVQQRQQQQQQQQRPASQPLPLAPDMLAVASHLAVLQAATPAGAQALQRVALPWPCGTGSSSSSSSDSSMTAAVRPGRPVFAAGAPFGVLAPQHFTGFLTTGIVSAVVLQATSGSGSGGSGGSEPALLLADLRCSPGMEGGPVFGARPTDTLQYTGTSSSMSAGSAAGAAYQQPALMGMLLPPLKAPAVQVEWAAVAPINAVAAAAEAVVGPAATVCGVPIGSARISGSSGSMGGSTSGSACLAASQPSTAAAAAALRGVVAVAVGGSWASGVLVSEAGHILTNAHLLQPASAAPSSSGSSHSGGSRSRVTWPQLRPSPAAAATHPPAQVLLPGAAAGGSSGESTTGGHWAAADVLYVFQGPLDLAVLKLRPTGQQRQAAWQPLKLSRQPPRPGQAVLVAGYPAYSPRSSPLGRPVLTAGTLAKVVPLPASGQPAMLLTSAAVHSGASGGAVVDAATGKLLGLVTSNAKHSSRGGSSSNDSGSGGGVSSGSGSSSPSSKQVTVLPHLNFSIPAAQLAPMLLAVSEAAAVEAAGGGAMGGAAGDAATVAAWRQLDAAGAADLELNQVWRMDPRQRQRQQLHEGGGSGGAFGGAAPPARLQRLLEQLAEQQRQGQQGQQGGLRAKL